MGDPPYRPVRELERAIQRGDLDFALGYARELVSAAKRPLGLELGLGLVGLVAAQRPDSFDAWAVRWFVRWIAQTRPTVARAAEIAGRLSDLGRQRSGAQEAIRRTLRGRRGQP